MAGLLENHKVTLSNLSSLRGSITPEDQVKITAFLESHNPSAGETDVFQDFSGALRYKFNNDGTITITYTDDGSSDTVPLSIFVKGGLVEAERPTATYSVTYRYISGTEGKELPSSITAPAVVSDKHTGDEVTSPSGQTDVEDATNQGTWHFTSWDKLNVTVGTADETVTGTWTFTATPGETPGTTPGTATPGTTPGTTTPGETPGTTPGTATPGETPGTTPGTATPGEAPGTTPGGNSDTTHNATDSYMSAVEDKKLTSSKAEGWSKKDGQWVYQLEDGSHIVNEWKQINGTWYRFDNSGVMQTGWVKENGTWYYLNKSGAMQTGWVNDNDKWYYLDQTGALAIRITTPDGYTVNADGEWVE